MAVSEEKIIRPEDVDYQRHGTWQNFVRTMRTGDMIAVTGEKLRETVRCAFNRVYGYGSVRTKRVQIENGEPVYQIERIK